MMDKRCLQNDDKQYQYQSENCWKLINNFYLNKNNKSINELDNLN